MIIKPKKTKIDRFTRWMVKQEAKNVAAGLPGYDQRRLEHSCRTPACIGGYLDRWPNGTPAAYWGQQLGLTEAQEERVFGYEAMLGRTALQAANILRRIAKLPALTKKDCK